MAPATVSAGWLWEMRSAIVARVRDRNPMEVADDLGHRFWRLLPYGRQFGSHRGVNALRRAQEKRTMRESEVQIESWIEAEPAPPVAPAN